MNAAASTDSELDTLTPAIFEEIRTLLKKTQFDQQGFRVIDMFSDDEWNFFKVKEDETSKCAFGMSTRVNAKRATRFGTRSSKS